MNRAFRSGSLAFRIMPAVLVLVIATGSAWCDEPGSPSGFRFRGAPGSVTRNFMITEFGVASVLDADADFPDLHVTWDLGVMHNFGARTALGGTVYLSFKDDYDDAFLLGVTPRFRYWPAGRLYFDVSAGLLLTEIGGNNEMDFGYPTLVAHAGIGYGDLISLALQYEEVEYSPTQYANSQAAHDNRWYLGLTSGSYIGAIIGPLVFVGISLLHDLS